MAGEENLSFIPKRPNEPKLQFKVKGTGFFFVFSLIVFFVSVAIFGGLFFYRAILNNDIKKLANSFNNAKSVFDLNLISDIAKVSDKINFSKSILAKHTTPVPFFDFLESSTLPEVRFTKFDYSVSKEGEYLVSLDGSARSYIALASQSKIFEKNSNFKNISFSGLSLGDKGLVNFKVQLSLTPEFLAYKINNEQQ